MPSPSTLKLLVEQNPQIPDRTKHLVGDGPDPTVSLYATRKRPQPGLSSSEDELFRAD
jgi:hypothetical protein